MGAPECLECEHAPLAGFHVGLVRFVRTFVFNRADIVHDLTAYRFFDVSAHKTTVLVSNGVAL
jgi:hypothetical protein